MLDNGPLCGLDRFKTCTSRMGVIGGRRQQLLVPGGFEANPPYSR